MVCNNLSVISLVLIDVYKRQPIEIENSEAETEEAENAETSTESAYWFIPQASDDLLTDCLLYTSRCV